MEEEARDILRRVMGEGAPPRNLAAAIRARVAPSNRVVLDFLAREPMRDPPQFGRGHCSKAPRYYQVAEVREMAGTA